ncbi:hypothetical protein [Xylophilus ampelinus]|uniref:hypothetical protein n=1 Tax=Xylophilus ampelinus TaxID=54067 RepID=UPI0011B73F6A|nr:hypothetical protein [Xylophilus ampelinus]MCS4508715.1 hypothetical protein [Xylophilus ampelinus]
MIWYASFGPNAQTCRAKRQAQLVAIADDEINGRPRKGLGLGLGLGLGILAPQAVYRKPLINSSRHSTLVHETPGVVLHF